MYYVRVAVVYFCGITFDVVAQMLLFNMLITIGLMAYKIHQQFKA